MSGGVQRLLEVELYETLFNVALKERHGKRWARLPPRALRLVRAWARLHTEELADNWARAQELEPLAPIEPLP